MYVLHVQLLYMSVCIYTSMPGMRCLESACVLRGDSVARVQNCTLHTLFIFINIYLWTNCFIKINIFVYK